MVALAAGLATGLAATARADELVMPFACHTDKSGVRISPSANTSYRILGRRDEQPFVDCDGRQCRTLMVHRFNLDCNGLAVPWARVAQAAANDTGIAFPQATPEGFAPVSPMSGRFVLPPLAHAGAALAKVMRQELIASAEPRDDEDDLQPSGWQTAILAEAAPASSDAGFMRVAASLLAVLSLLFAASAVAAGRLIRIPAFVRDRSYRVADPGPAQTLQAIMAILSRLCRQYHPKSSEGDALRAASQEVINALLALRARLLKVELKIAALEPSLLLRDVLTGEVANVRTRMAAVEGAIARMPDAKAATALRGLLRDLDRIDRIADSANEDAVGGNARCAAERMPQTTAEAYRILGINPDAAPAIAKKLVDALRLSWHPDHARDAADRQRREQRMKQINAAWDLVKARRAAA